MATIGVLAAPQAASAAMYVQNYGATYTGPTAMADCNAAGKYGVSHSQWDFYRCSPYAGMAYLAGYVRM
ncbi:hypothetical protein AB0M36_37560 [Actinoplanes sp. NPDC051346]|uniref:hypothetical protein n=1 Tax=Actinoplanes sp. NPDC051346 TaxID=3155048 RepID=UPI0034373F38